VCLRTETLITHASGPNMRSDKKISTKKYNKLKARLERAEVGESRAQDALDYYTRCLRARNIDVDDAHYMYAILNGDV